MDNRLNVGDVATNNDNGEFYGTGEGTIEGAANKVNITSGDRADNVEEGNVPPEDMGTGEDGDGGDYPDGFDSELYNLETNSLKEDGVRARLKAKDEEIEKLNRAYSEAKAMLNKSLKAPDDVEAYKAYKPDSKFEKFMDSDDGKKLFGELTEFAKDNGLTVEQHRAMVDYINEFAEKQGLVDTRSEIEKAQQLKDWKAEQYKLIGENAEVVIKENVDFIKDFIFFNEDQKKELLGLMDSGAVGVSIVNRFRELLDRTPKDGNTAIPTSVSTGGLEDDETLWKKFLNAKTSEESEAIINARIRAGRPSEWKHS